MLERLQQWAGRFAVARPWLLALAILMLCVCGWIVLTSSGQDDDMALIPATLMFAWATMLYSFLNLFLHVPAPVQTGMSFGRRFATRLKRCAYHVFALLMGAVTVLLLITTLQLTSAWRTMY